MNYTYTNDGIYYYFFTFMYTGTVHVYHTGISYTTYLYYL